MHKLYVNFFCNSLHINETPKPKSQYISSSDNYYTLGRQHECMQFWQPNEMYFNVYAAV